MKVNWGPVKNIQTIEDALVGIWQWGRAGRGGELTRAPERLGLDLGMSLSSWEARQCSLISVPPAPSPGT